MEPSRRRSILIYGAIGVVLLLAVVIGIQFAKNRSSQVVAEDSSKPTSSNQNQDQNKPAESNGNNNGNNSSATGGGTSNQPNQQQTPSGNEQKPSTGNNQGSTLGTSAGRPIPATGPADSLLVAVGPATVALSVGLYIQSRRRLTSLS